jgi:dihydrofolate synthase/folylpolyglutamate synthase
MSDYDDDGSGGVERGDESALARLLGAGLGEDAIGDDERDELDEDAEAMSETDLDAEEAVAAFARAQQEVLARAPEHDVQPSLDRIRLLVDLLGEPQRAYPVVHVTGTNGKTTTTRLVEALLREFGLRTGRFTSPHLHAMTERIAVDGDPISGAAFARAWDEIKPFVELVDARSEIPMTYFEVLAGLAYAVFADTPVDVAVVEVGMGGTWDATNVADGRVAVVTPVAIDHTRFLGSTVEEIAAEKAGIIKPGAVAVLAQQPVEAAEVILRHAADVGATVVREGIEYGVTARSVAVGGQQLTLQGLGGVYDDVFLPLHGVHQAHNAATALAAVEAFLGGGQGRLDVDVVRAAFAGATSPGRLEVVRRSPTVLVDAAHNPAGALATAEAIRDAFDFTRLVGVVAAFGDKDVEGILTAFEPVMTEVVVTQMASPRAMPLDELTDVAEGIFGVGRVTAVARLEEAIDEAVRRAESQGELSGAGVLVTGSITTVAQARALFGAD